MDDDAIPPSIAGNLRIRIHAGLLRIDAEWHSNPASRVAPLQAAFDAFAHELLAAGQPLTDEMLSEIAACVCKWGRAHNWMSKVIVQAGGRPPIPVPFAESLKHVRADLKGRISYWRAEALLAGIGIESESVRPTGPESPMDLLARVQARHTMDEIAHRIGISRSTLYLWKRQPTEVKPEIADAILTGLRQLGKASE
jgi:hypothetical protein